MEHDDDAISAFMEVPAGAEDLDEHEDTFAGESDGHAVDGTIEQETEGGQALPRIEESWAFTWGGTTSCCREDKVRDQLSNQLAGWVKAKAAQHPAMRVLRSGYGEVKVQCRSWKDPFPNQERHCNGSASTIFFVEFAS